MYRVYRDGTIKQESSVDVIRQSRQRYDLWIDLDAGVFSERTKGAVDLRGKRILGRLLVFLIADAGKPFLPEEIFEPVWSRKVIGLSEQISVRSSISRLRDLIEPTPPRWKYIQKREPAFWECPGAYFFEPVSNYCMIVRQSFTMFPM